MSIQGNSATTSVVEPDFGEFDLEDFITGSAEPGK